MWSSPRNLSTAMMYAWRQRRDTTVVDEPLYAHYLRVSGRGHPGTDDVLAAQDPDGATVVADLLLGRYETPVVFFKQMAKHLVDLDRSFLPRFRNVLLTRDPHDMLSSFQVQIPDATLDDTGLPEMIEILETLLEAGEEPIVIDSKLLLQNPRNVLSELCDRLGLTFDEAMLTLAARAETGGRRVGTTLVRQCPSLDRLAAVRSEARRAAAERGRHLRGVACRCTSGCSPTESDRPRPPKADRQTHRPGSTQPRREP